MNKNYGYIRVSTKEQNESRQLLAMHEAGREGNDLHRQAEREGFFAAAVQAHDAPAPKRRCGIHTFYRQAWTKL